MLLQTTYGSTDICGGKSSQLLCLVQDLAPRELEAEKVHQEKVQQEKLKEVKARLNFEVCSGRNTKIQEVSQHSESKTLNVRGDLRRRLRSRHSNSMFRSLEPSHSVFSRIRRERSESPRNRLGDKGRKEGVVFKRMGNGAKHSQDAIVYHEGTSSRRTEPLSDSGDSGGGYWKSRSKKKKSSIEEDDLSQPWVCEETDHFTPRIHYFDFPKKTRMPSNVKTYDESDDLEDHLKISKVWFNDLPLESVDSYDDLKKAFLANFLQQKKCIKDPVEIHHIKQREGESTEDFVQRFKTESRHSKGALECMRISGFVHGITNPELIKRLHDKIPKSVDEMMRVTTTFLRGEVAASNQVRKKTLSAWKQ
ncbi:reverse transcriptase domain-containing protein [Tanacetum coccineum]